MMSNSNDYLLAAALAYAELGYPVFPCAPHSKKPLTEHGFLDASTDPEVIERWWTANPQANIGIPTEGLVIIDVDGKNNTWLTDAPEKMLELADTVVSITPRGGRHYIFRQPAGKAWRGSTGALAHKVDVRANGNYIVVAPSIWCNDKAYTWVENCELDVPPEELSEPPAWLIELLDKVATGATTLAQGTISSTNANLIPDGQRNSTLTKLAGSMRRVGMSQTEILAALKQVNIDRCRPPLSQTEVEKIATSVSRYEPNQISVALVEDHWAQQFGSDQTTPPQPKNIGQLTELYSSLRKPVIHGLLREGETMNVIAPSKLGKSWLVIDLALAIATGRPWLGMECEAGEVLIIDNELHGETSANRIPKVANARNIALSALPRNRAIQSSISGVS